MTRATPPFDAGPEPVDERGFGLVALLIIMATHKKVLVLFPLAAALVAAAVSLVVPEVYRASAKVLPAQQGRPSAALLMAQLIGSASAINEGDGALRPIGLYAEMLASRNVEDALIRKFDLDTVYHAQTREKTRETLKANTFIRAGMDGLISIDVEDGDRNRAAQLANAYSDELLRLTREIALSEASKRRAFFERELQLSGNKLVRTERQLSASLADKGVLSVEGIGRVMVETIAELKARISAKEVELAAMRGFVTPRDPEYRSTAAALASLRSGLSNLENGRAAVDGAARNQGAGNAADLRDMKSQQMLYELRAAQYELARLDEANPPSVIQVLDRAVAPDKRLRPKRALLVIVTTFYAMCGAIFWVFLAEVIARARWMPGGARRWQRLKSHAGFRGGGRRS